MHRNGDDFEIVCESGVVRIDGVDIDGSQLNCSISSDQVLTELKTNCDGRIRCTRESMKFIPSICNLLNVNYACSGKIDRVKRAPSTTCGHETFERKHVCSPSKIVEECVHSNYKLRCFGSLQQSFKVSIFVASQLSYKLHTFTIGNDQLSRVTNQVVAKCIEEETARIEKEKKEREAEQISRGNHRQHGSNVNKQQGQRTREQQRTRVKCCESLNALPKYHCTPNKMYPQDAKDWTCTHVGTEAPVHGLSGGHYVKP